ncbi:MAG: aminodeoxychorismate synthase component I [Alphaproteobacteria bacterium]|nr:aminodeoxychorismate synthase component I [Alphaproteobacteria bacterium]
MDLNFYQDIYQSEVKVTLLPWRNPGDLLPCFDQMPGFILFESNGQEPIYNHYSFIVFNPFMVFKSHNHYHTLNDIIIKENPYSFLKKIIQKFSFKPLPNLPPFQTGIAGFWGYESARFLGFTIETKELFQKTPDIVLGFYDQVLAFDHHKKSVYLFTRGNKAKLQIEAIKKRFDQPIKIFDYHSKKPSIPKAFLTEKEYTEKIDKIISYLYQGQIYQTNFTFPFFVKLPEYYNAQRLYYILKTINPAPFSAYLNFDDIKIISSSPERFLKLDHGNVTTSPIKGTIPRHKNKNLDNKNASLLQNNPKDQSENLMIVDLLRNDLSKVCEDHSVTVPQLFKLETYPSIFHLVSTITGKLKEDKDAIDLFIACFPGGSITGAPKISAMTIIDKLEHYPRGSYCGSIGYIGFDQSMDTNIAIRTIVLTKNLGSFHVGSGIVIDSNPHSEYEECLAKAKLLIEAFQR